MARKLYFHCVRCNCFFHAHASAFDGYSVIHRKCGRKVYPTWRGLLP